MTSATFCIFVCSFPSAFDNFITYIASNLELIELRFYVPPDKIGHFFTQICFLLPAILGHHADLSVQTFI